MSFNEQVGQKHKASKRMLELLSAGVATATGYLHIQFNGPRSENPISSDFGLLSHY
jgi:hypothetical protein